MEFYVDDRRVETDLVASGTVEETLREVQARLCGPERMVVALRCDGEDIPAGEMEATLLEPTLAFKRLEVFTVAKQALVADAMLQASTSLEQTAAQCQSMADLLIEGKTADAIQALGECLAVWQQIHQAVAQSIEVLQLDVERTMVDGQPLLNLITGPKEALLQIKQALVSKDYVLLADLLRYEFDDVTSSWRALIAWLEQEAQAA